MKKELIEQLSATLKSTKKQISENLELITKNENRVKILLSYPVSNERTASLNKVFKENRNLLSNNKDLTNLIFQIERFIEDHKQEQIGNENPLEINYDECMQLTMLKELDFDTNHPYYEDENFRNELIQYFTDIEDYEECDRIKNA